MGGESFLLIIVLVNCSPIVEQGRLYAWVLKIKKPPLKRWFFR